jgi:hypothetical protein
MSIRVSLLSRRLRNKQRRRRRKKLPQTPPEPYGQMSKLAGGRLPPTFDSQDLQAGRVVAAAPAEQRTRRQYDMPPC